MKKKIYKSISKDIKFDERWELFVKKALKLIMMIMLVAARQYKLLLPPIITDCMEKVRRLALPCSNTVIWQQKTREEMWKKQISTFSSGRKLNE